MSDKNLSVGDRVQWIDYSDRNNEVIYTGAVTELTLSEREKRGGYSSYYRPQEKVMEKYTSHLTVKWDDGEEETLEYHAVYAEDSALEREFRKAIPSAISRIDEKLALASKYLDEATAISEETGIPFSASISYLGQSYTPASLEKKFPELERDFVNDLTGTYNEYGGAGWEHSAVC